MAAPQCIFCRIVNGEIPSTKVHEDAHTLAFLDIQPLAKGHVLVVPKTHHAHLQDMPKEGADALWHAVHALVSRVETALQAEATTVAVNNGRAAGQEVPHVHVHVVPRTSGDAGGPIHAAFPERPTVSREEMSEIQKRILAV